METVPLIKLQNGVAFDPRVIVRAMVNALKDDVEMIAAEVQQGVSEVWVSPLRGFLVTRIEIENDVKTLYILGIEGYQLYTRAGMKAIEQLATNEKCDIVRVQAKARVVQRIITQRFGFVETAEDPNVFIKVMKRA